MISTKDREPKENVTVQFSEEGLLESEETESNGFPEGIYFQRLLGCGG